LRDFTEGVLEGLAYSRMVTRREKRVTACAKITRQILEILDAQGEDFKARSRATA
jgi:hypothetical protein